MNGRAYRLERGATLLDTVVGIALMLMVFVAIIGAFRLTLDVVINSKARIGALALANERMEYIRSLSYDAVGTQGGIPSGTLVQVEQESLNGVNYTRRVLVRYIDDPADGTGAADENGIIADAKEVKAEVSWDSGSGTRRVSLVSRFSPPGIETEVPGGTLLISVVDAQAQPVSGATVTIENLDVDPVVSVTAYTDIAGIVSFIGAPAGSGYQITVSKPSANYSTAQTYSVSAELAQPSPGHLTVAEGLTTAATFGIDAVAQVTVNSYEYPKGATTTPVLSNIPFSLRGATTIGTNGSGEPVYAVDLALDTGASGQLVTGNLPWDSYTVSVDGVATGYDIAESCNPQPTTLAPGDAVAVSLYLAPHTANSLLVDVRTADDTLITGASVTLSRNTYSEGQTSSDCGQVFFSGLVSGTVGGGNPYTLDVSASGYEAFQSTEVEVSGSSRLTVVLNSL